MSDFDPYAFAMESINKAGVADPSPSSAMSWYANDLAQRRRSGESVPERANLFLNGLRGGARFIGGALEPIQWSQDVLFSVWDAALEEEEGVTWQTFQEAWGRVEHLKYAPWGATPQRPAAFRDILEGMGVEGEAALRLGGLAGDILIDPLLVGGLVGGIGKSAKLLGFSDDLANSLMKAGNIIDDTLDLVPSVARNVTNANINRLYKATTPAPIREAVSDMYAKSITGILNMDFPFQWMKPLNKRTSGATMSVGDFIFPDGRGMNTISGESAAIQRIKATLTGALGGDPNAVGAGRSLRTINAQRSADAASDVYVNEVVQRLQTIKDTFTEQGFEKWIRGMDAGPQRLRAAWQETGTQMDVEAQDALMNAVTGVMRQSGILPNQGVVEALPANLQREYANIRKAFEAGTIETPGLSTMLRVAEQESERMIGTAEDVLGSLAKRKGMDPEQYVGDFRKVLQATQEAHALTSYQEVMYEPMKNLFFTNSAQLLLDSAENPKTAARIVGAAGSPIAESTAAGGGLILSDHAAEYLETAWQKMIAGVVTGQEDIRLFGNVNNTVLSNLTVGGALGSAVRQTEQFSGVNFREYIQNLVGGGLNNTYAVFSDPLAWTRWANNLVEGKVIPNHIVQDSMIDAVEAQHKGFKSAFNSYVETIEAARVGDKRGLIYRTDRMAQHLIDQGFSPSDAQGAMNAFVGEMREDLRGVVGRASAAGARLGGMFNAPTHPTGITTGIDSAGNTVARLDAAAVKYGGLRASSKRIPEFNNDPDMQEILGILDQGIISVMERARRTAETYSHGAFMNDIYGLGKRNGLVLRAGTTENGRFIPGEYDDLRRLDKDNKLASEFINVGASETQFGEFAGKWVHKTLWKEMQNAVARKNYTPGHLQQVRSVISSGYLASPASTSANFAGGLYTGWLMGFNPWELLRQFPKVISDWRKHGADFEDLQKVGSISGGVAHSDLIRQVGDLKDFTSGLADRSNITVQLERLASAFQGVMESPLTLINRPSKIGKAFEGSSRLAESTNLVSSSLGLNGFSAVENIFKIAALRAGKAKGMSELASRQAARHLVFDYASLPDSMALLRDTGLALFPGFPTFMMGRTLTAAIERPGLLGAFNRAPDALWEATVPDEGERMAVYASMGDWMKEGRFIPIYRKGQEWSMMNLEELIPTNALSGANIVDNLTSLGIWGPFLDIAVALANGDGTAPISRKYGQEVFQPEEGPLSAARAGSVAAFAYNSFAPAFARKLFKVDTRDDSAAALSGLGPAFVRTIQERVKEAPVGGREAYTAFELYRRRINKTLADEAIGFTLRSVQKVSTDNAIQGVRKQLDSMGFEYSRKISSLTNAFRSAKSRGDAGGMQRAREAVAELRKEQAARQRALLNAYNGNFGQ